jgi:hypothetical protein
MKRYLLAASMLAAACSDSTTNAPTQLNFDRPVDIAFACFGGLRITGGGAASLDQEIVSSAQPIASCDVRSGPRESVTDKPAPPGQEDMQGSVVGGASYYAFVLQSGPGTVALARFETKPATAYAGGEAVVLDVDPLTPGKNGITVGEDPIAIVTDRVGCFEVIANKGSCDLSTLEINSIGLLNGDATSRATVNRMVVKNAAGQPIYARPAAMVVEPPSGVIGNFCPATPTGLVYIAYPGCHMVAGVDTSTGTIVTSITFAADGSALVGDGNVSCPSECDGAGTVSAGFRPVALDLEYDQRSGRRLLAIGADNSNLVTAYDLDAAFRPLVSDPATPSIRVALENTNGRLGTFSIAITPQIGMGGSMGAINDDTPTGGNHQFIYAVANDGTVRVIDIEGVPRECDTQIDPRYLREERDVAKLACLPLGDPTLPRRPGARGPGIELTGEAVPTSVETFRVEPLASDQRDPGTPGRLIGYFGMITAANGLTFVVNIDDDDYPDYVEPSNPLATQIPLVVPHQLRDNVQLRGLLAEDAAGFVCDDAGPDPDASGAQKGGPRLTGSIQRTVPTGTLATEKFGGLPSIRQVFCDAASAEAEDRPVPEIFFSAPLDVRESVFPDLRATRADETWTLTWEGSLSLDSGTTAIDGPSVREAQMFADGAGIRMVDASKPYCEVGVEPYDVLQLRGCDPSLGDAGCPLGYTCFVHPQSQVAGLGACMLTNEAERLANACRDFLVTLRRYTIVNTKSGELQLLPRKHELRTTPITGCTDDAQCQALANYAAAGPSSLNPIDDRTPADSHTWACRPDPDRRPDANNVPRNRCLMTCEVEADCVAGTVCSDGYCMESVTPPQSCINAAQRYELRAGEAFAVLGTRTGYQHPIIADANGNCVRDPNAHPLLAGRIPLSAPACDPTADPRTGRRIDGTYDPNPCELTVDETEYQLNYVDETCTLGMPDEEIVTRDATALRLRNKAMTLTLVDPTYQGDLRCHGDRAGTLIDIPLVAPGYQIAFRQTAGFIPLVLSAITPSFPIKVTRGPGQSIWVIDEGDFLSTSITQPSTRGKVYRVESHALGIVNVLD